MKSTIVNAAGTIVQNLIRFTPVTVAGYLAGPEQRPLSMAASVSLMQPIANEASSFLTRWCGGTRTELRIGTPGAVRSVESDTVQKLVNVAAYGLIHAVWSLKPGNTESFALQFVRQFLAAVAMGLVGGIVTHVLAKKTLKCHNAAQPWKLPIHPDSRLKPKLAAYQFALPKWDDRTIKANKVKEVVAGWAGNLPGAVVLGELVSVVPEAASPAVRSLIEVAAGYSVMFALDGVCAGIYTNWWNHPKYNADKFETAAHKINLRDIFATRFELSNSVLDAYRAFLRNSELLANYGTSPDQLLVDNEARATFPAQAIYYSGRHVLSGAAYTNLGLKENISWLQSILQQMADSCDHINVELVLGNTVPNHIATGHLFDPEQPEGLLRGRVGKFQPEDAAVFDPTVPFAGTLKALKVALQAGADILRREFTSMSLHEAGVNPFLQDLRRRIKDAHIMIGQCSIQLGMLRTFTESDNAEEVFDAVVRARAEATTRLANLMGELMPLFAANREADTDVKAQVLTDYANKMLQKNLPMEKVVDLIRNDPNVADLMSAQQFAENIIEGIARNCRSFDRSPEFVDAVEALIKRGAIAKENPGYNEARLAIFRNLVNESSELRVRESEARDRVNSKATLGPMVDGPLSRFEARFRQQPVTERGKADLRDWFVRSLKDCRFTVGQVAWELSRLEWLHKVAVEMQHDDERRALLRPGDLEEMQRNGDRIDFFTSVMGKDFVRALRTDPAPDLQAFLGDRRLADLALGEHGHLQLAALMEDINRTPEHHRASLVAALCESRPVLAAALKLYEQHDPHFHGDNYNNKAQFLESHLVHMNASNIVRSSYMGIPSQDENPDPLAKYYAVSRIPTLLDRILPRWLGGRQGKAIEYRSTDLGALAAYHRLDKDLRKRFDLCITGPNLTYKGTMAQELVQRMRIALAEALKELKADENPDYVARVLRAVRTYDIAAFGEVPRPFGAFTRVGEMTGKKEIVMYKNPRMPSIDSQAMTEFLVESTNFGFPITLHNDNGDPHRKDRWEEKLTRKLIEVAQKIASGELPDTLATRLPGIDKDRIPPRQFAPTHAHAGISKYTAPARNHTRMLLERMNNKDMRYTWDMSWDVVAVHMYRDIYDLLKKRNVSQPILEALDALLKRFSVFNTEGGRSDSASDIGMVTAVAAHGVAADTQTQKFMEALANFHFVLGQELKTNPAVVAAFIELFDEHGDDGNNWFYTTFQGALEGRVVPGSDALNPGVKAHGDGAFAINTKMMYPLYGILETMAECVPSEADRFLTACENFRTKNWERLQDDPAILKRRLFAEMVIYNNAYYDFAQSTIAKPWTAPVVGSTLDEDLANARERMGVAPPLALEPYDHSGAAADEVRETVSVELRAMAALRSEGSDPPRDDSTRPDVRARDAERSAALDLQQLDRFIRLAEEALDLGHTATASETSSQFRERTDLFGSSTSSGNSGIAA